jgi:hypothetical protein
MYNMQCALWNVQYAHSNPPTPPQLTPLHTQVLLGSLQGEESFTRPPYHDLRHPMIFYYGHPAAFYTNKLRVAGLTGAINPYFEVVFETGVDEMSWDDLSKNHMAWPTVAEVHEYRKQVSVQLPLYSSGASAEHLSVVLYQSVHVY